MKRNYSLKFTPFDGIVGGILLLLIIVAIITTNIFYSNNSKGERIIEMYLNGEQLKDKSVSLSKLEEDLTIVISKEDYPNSSLIDDIIVEINPDKGVRIKEVDCPNNVCINQGWVNRVGFTIACLPNGFIILIRSTGVDEPIVLG